MRGALIGDLYIPVHANAKPSAKVIELSLVHGCQLLVHFGQSRLGGQAVAVAHAPEPTLIVAQSRADVLKTVDLTVHALAGLTADRGKVVAVDGAGARSDGAGRSLGAVPLVSGDTLLGRHGI